MYVDVMYEVPLLPSEVVAFSAMVSWTFHRNLMFSFEMALSSDARMSSSCRVSFLKLFWEEIQLEKLSKLKCRIESVLYKSTKHCVPRQGQAGR